MCIIGKEEEEEHQTLNPTAEVWCKTLSRIMLCLVIDVLRLNSAQTITITTTRMRTACQSLSRL